MPTTPKLELEPVPPGPKPPSTGEPDTLGEGFHCLKLGRRTRKSFGASSVGQYTSVTAGACCRGGVVATIKKFDTSGKSPAHIQHRRNFRTWSFPEALPPGMREQVAARLSAPSVSDLPLHLRREEACCPFKDWSGGAGGWIGDRPKISFDTSGKSLANIHHRKKFKKPAPGNRPRAFSMGFSNRTATRTSRRHILLHIARASQAGRRPTLSRAEPKSSSASIALVSAETRSPLL